MKSNREELEAIPIKPLYLRIVVEHTRNDTYEERHAFALHKSGARLCRLLESLLDANDVSSGSKNINTCTDYQIKLPTIYIPQASKDGIECVFAYLEEVQTRVPSVISKPLKAPLDELTQPWEMKYILHSCLGLPRASLDHHSKLSDSIIRTILKRGSTSLDRIIEVAMISDFLLIESLRDLTCSFLAFIALSITSEKELLQLCNTDHLLSNQELEPLYKQFPFLREREEERDDVKEFI